MVLCDLAARTLAVPREIPIGSITALIGSPFFIYIYFGETEGEIKLAAGEACKLRI